MTPSASQRAGMALALAGIAAASMILLHSAAAPIMGDYCEWVYHGVLLRDVMQAHPNPHYLLKHYPVPNSLGTIGMGLLMLLLPWKTAAKVWLICSFAVGFSGAVSLSKAAGKLQPWKLLVTVSAVLLAVPFWGGFVNFLFGIYFTMFLCALLLRGSKSSWAYAALLVAAFFSHMIPFGFALLVFALYILQTRRWSLAWQAVPGLALTLWYLSARFLAGNPDGNAGMTSSIPYGSAKFLLFRVNDYLKCWGIINPSSTFEDSILIKLSSPGFFVVLFLLNAIIAAGVLYMLLRAAGPSLRPAHPRRFLWLALVLFFGIGLIMPGAAAGISDPGGRMMQVAVWCAFPLVEVRRRLSGAVLATCATVFIAVNCWLLDVVALRPQQAGIQTTRLPAAVQVFGHILYVNRVELYDQIDRNQMDGRIYPTAMFLPVQTKPEPHNATPVR